MKHFKKNLETETVHNAQPRADLTCSAAEDDPRKAVLGS